MSLSKVANPTYQTIPYNLQGYRTFSDFYPYYLGEHRNPTCRRLHLIGTTISLTIQTRLLASYIPTLADRLSLSIPPELGVRLVIPGGGRTIAKLAALGLLQGYVWAWVGHYFFEKNRPATFKHPLWSFMGDLQMWKEIFLRQRRA